MSAGRHAQGARKDSAGLHGLQADLPLRTAGIVMWPCACCSHVAPRPGHWPREPRSVPPGPTRTTAPPAVNRLRRPGSWSRLGITDTARAQLTALRPSMILGANRCLDSYLHPAIRPKALNTAVVAVDPGRVILLAYMYEATDLATIRSALDRKDACAAVGSPFGGNDEAPTGANVGSQTKPNHPESITRSPIRYTARGRPHS